MKELRFCVGNADAERSTAWKLWAQKNDLYLHSSGMGADLKVSFHATGQCHVAATARAIVEAGIRNSQRYTTKWSRPHPDSQGITRLLQLVIPRSEMRVGGRLRSRKSVSWLPSPPMGHAVLIDILNVRSASAVAKGSYAQWNRIGGVNLQNGVEGVALWRSGAMGPHDLELLDQLRRVAIPVPNGQNEAIAWGHIRAEPDFHAMLEFVPTTVPHGPA